MNNILDWFDASQFCRGETSLDENGEAISPLNGRAVKFDLYGAICWQFNLPSQLEDRMQAIRKVKTAYKALFPEKWNNNKNLDYYKKNGTTVWLEPRLYRLSDELSDADLTKLLAFI